MCNAGCIRPKDGFLQGLRDICDDYGIALIFDEVITGFRLSLGGAQQLFGVTPDISIFAKAMASGYPISAVAGKREWMHLLEDGKVIHAGTMNTGNATVAAALATIETLEKENPFEQMTNLATIFMDGLKNAALESGQNLLIQGIGPMFNICFTNLPEINDYRDTFQCNKAKLGKLISGMHDRKIRIIGRGLIYISAAHTLQDIEHAISKARETLMNL
jgi:glutamate-1-semialdehyde 2,1-aminomutase